MASLYIPNESLYSALQALNRAPEAKMRFMRYELSKLGYTQSLEIDLEFLFLKVWLCVIYQMKAYSVLSKP